jgi:serine/threonine-protein kinase
VERARREASIRLHNDNLVEMLAFIEMPGRMVYGQIQKQYYVVSELLEGVMLDSILEGVVTDRYGRIVPLAQKLLADYQRNPDEFAAYIVRNVLAGLLALHNAGYIHRDIDPTNIMVTTDGKVKLIDFGIAKKVDVMAAQKSELTTPGQFIGKAEYAAPELILGDTGHQNAYTDVYAIGILYYQLVVGSIPFEGSKYDVIECQLHKKVPVKNISSWQIREIIKTATAKKQSDRYASSALFRAAIDNIVDPEPRRIPWNIIGGDAAAVILAALIFMAIPKGGGAGEQTAPEEITETISPLKACLEKLKTADSDSVKAAFEELKQMAEEGDSTALVEVAQTYALFLSPDAEELSTRQQKLGFLGDLEHTDRAQAVEAVKWLKKAIENDENNYKAKYKLAYYYFGGFGGLANNNSRALALSQEALQLARQAGDDAYAMSISTFMNYIKE